MTGEHGSPPLVCPTCLGSGTADGGAGAPGARFCDRCGMPLVHAGPHGEDSGSEVRRRARKIKPQYVEGDLVRVAGGRHQAEAEMIQGLLLEEGIPSMLRRARGFDVPDMLAAGPRDVLVPASGAAAAREALLQAELVPTDAMLAASQADRRRLAMLLVLVVLVAVVALLGAELLS